MTEENEKIIIDLLREIVQQMKELDKTLGLIYSNQ